MVPFSIIFVGEFCVTIYIRCRKACMGSRAGRIPGTLRGIFKGCEGNGLIRAEIILPPKALILSRLLKRDSPALGNRVFVKR